MTPDQHSKLRAMLRRLGAEDLKEHPPSRAHSLRVTSASCRRALLSGTPWA